MHPSHLRPKVSQIVADGVSLCVERSGCGSPILCLPAIGHDARDFDALAALVGDKFELVRIEWPGQGRSEKDRMPASARRYAALLVELVPQLGIDNPIVIGNSIGGAAAILYAAEHRVRALVLCNCGGLTAVGRDVKAFCGMFERFFAAGERGAFWYPSVFAFYYRLVLVTGEAAAQRARIIASSRALAPIFREAWASFAAADSDLREIAARLEVPVWVAWAKRDKIIPLSRCRATIGAMKHATLSLFKAGHAAFLEQPQAFAREFERFVAGLESAPAAPTA